MKFKLHDYGGDNVYWTFEDECGSTKSITLSDFQLLLYEYSKTLKHRLQGLEMNISYSEYQQLLSKDEKGKSKRKTILSKGNKGIVSIPNKNR